MAVEANASGIVNLLRTAHDVCGGRLAFAVLPGQGPADDGPSREGPVTYPEPSPVEASLLVAVASQLQDDPEYAEGRVVVRRLPEEPGNPSALVVVASPIRDGNRSGVLAIATDPAGIGDLPDCLGGLAWRLTAYLSARRAVAPMVQALGVRSPAVVDELTRRARRLAAAIQGLQPAEPWALAVVAAVSAEPAAPVAKALHEWMRYGDPMVEVGAGQAATVVLVAPGSSAEAIARRLADRLGPAYRVGLASAPLVQGAGAVPGVATLLESAVADASASEINRRRSPLAGGGGLRRSVPIP